MTIRQAFLLVLVWALAACLRQGGGDSIAVTATRSCSPLFMWRMPAGDFVTSSAAESRPYRVVLTQARIDAIAMSAAAYCAVEGSYPPSYEAMVQFRRSMPAHLTGCAFRDDHDLLHDGWGQPIYYSVVGAQVHIASAGPDGRFTTADDVTLPKADDSLAEAIELSRDCAPRSSPLR